MRFFILMIGLSLLSACALDEREPIQKKLVSYYNGQQLRLDEILEKEELPTVAFQQAFNYINAHQSEIENKNWLSVIDFTLPSNLPRLFVLDLNSGSSERFLVAHGEGSDPEDTGFARRFSNIEGSLMTSLGFYLVNEVYYGNFGISARLDGLSRSNSNARVRNIVLHGFDGVTPEKSKPAMTQGCPAVELRFAGDLIQRLHGKSLLYAYIEGL